VPGDAEGEGLAGPGPPHHQGNAGAATTEVGDHRGLVRAGAGVGSQGGPDGLMARHACVLAGAVDRGRDQPLLHGQELGGGPAPLLHRPLGHHRDRPLEDEPVGQLLQFGAGGAGEVGAEGGQHLGPTEGGRGRGQPGRANQPVERLDHRPLRQVLMAVAGPVGHLPDQGVPVVSAFGRLRPPPSRQGVRGLVVFGFAGGLHGPLDQPGCPFPPGSFQPLHLQVYLAGAFGEQPDQVLG
jgi:hypothetical protein